MHIRTPIAAFACILATVASEAQAAPRKTRNVVLIVADDHGMNDAGCYGNTAIRTPGIDSLARNALRFTHAFCTTASCSASRSVILSGLHNHANGQYGHEHSYHHFRTFDNVKTLPALLSQAGFRTARVGKFHVGPPEVYPFQHTLRGNAPEPMAEAARAFIAEDEAPFFLYYCTTEPHRPFKREGSDAFDPKEVDVPPYLPDTPECREELAAYYGSVQRMDRGVGRLIEVLKELGRWEDTLVIYISDNGIAFPGSKTTLYEPGMRLPCLIRYPDAPQQGGVCDAMVTWADLTPTILDCVGAPAEGAEFHGRSFRAVLDGQPAENWDEVYASHTFHEITMYYPMRVVRTRQYKLLLNLAHQLPFPFASDLQASATWKGVLARDDAMYGPRSVAAYCHRPRYELYDLKADPWESKNLADDPAHAAVLADLQKKLQAWQRATGDPWTVKYDHE
jgi:N-sulfoglucosamine sulfohydrolase